MGDLIVMTRSARSFDRHPPAGASADILFFTGVRYVRITDDIVPTPPRRRRAKTKPGKDLQCASHPA